MQPTFTTSARCGMLAVQRRWCTMIVGERVVAQQVDNGCEKQGQDSLKNYVASGNHLFFVFFLPII